MEYNQLERLIAKLGDQVDSAASGRESWRDVWASIRTIGTAFKSTKYRTKDDKNAAWSRFQSLVERVKEQQERSRDNRRQNEWTSERHKAAIIAHAEGGRPSSDLISGMLEMLVHAMTAGLLRNDYKYDLEKWSLRIREAWRMFSERKEEMLGRDKKEVFERLRELQAEADAAWERWRDARQQAYDARQHRRGERRDRAEENVRKLEGRVERLYEILRRRESHQAELEQKRASAWNDSYRERVEGWIAEEEGRITEIRVQIRQVEAWLEEARTRLDRLS